MIISSFEDFTLGLLHDLSIKLRITNTGQGQWDAIFDTNKTHENYFTTHR